MTLDLIMMSRFNSFKKLLTIEKDQMVKSMETIFNQDITIDEIKVLNKLNPGRKIDNKIVYEISTEDDLRNADLSRLFFIRGNQQIAEKYLNEIKDPKLKYFLTH